MWLTALQKELGGEVSDEKMRDYIWNTLKSGRVNAQQGFKLNAESSFARLKRIPNLKCTVLVIVMEARTKSRVLENRA